MAQVVGISLVGRAYQRGMWMPGWTTITLDDKTVVTLPESKEGMNGPLDEMDRRGHDTQRMRVRLDEWVKTGKLPAHDENEPAGEVTFSLIRSKE